MTLDDIVAFLDPKAKGKIQGTAKIELTDLGSILLTAEGAAIGDGDAEVTLSATQAIFKKILDGSQNPMMAYMGGKLKIDGSMGRAMKVSEILNS
ncbi:MAG: SCP2 sterol-binding domain-containing protein [Pseudomonadota bacterium]